MRSVPVALAVVSFGSAIRAQPLAGAPPVSPSMGGSTSERNATAHQADALFNQAQDKIAERDLSGGLALLEQCYELTGSKNLLYNMARLQQDLKDCSGALSNYKLFVRDAVDGAWRDDAKQQIALLESTCATAAPVAPAPPAGAVHPSDPKPLPPGQAERPTRTFPWTTVGSFALGVGTLSTITTVYFAQKAIDAKRQTDTPAGNAQVFYARAADLTRNSTYAWTFGAVSVVALGLGAYALVVGARKEPTTPAERSHISAIVLPSGSAIEYTTAF